MAGFIQQLISEGEHQQLDFKFELSDSKKTARTLAAFANTDGGRLLVGVKDNGAIAGVRSDEEFYMVEAAANMYCRPTVEFSVREWREAGKLVLEVVVPKSLLHHQAPDKNDEYRYFIRVKDENFPAHPVQVRVWEKEANPQGVYVEYTPAEQMLLNFLEEKGRISFREFKQMSGYSKKRCEHILAGLVVLNVMSMHYDQSGVYFTLSQQLTE